MSESWVLIPHIHVACGGGRLLMREESCGTVVIKCANCEEETVVGADGRNAHTSMCFCGVAVAKVRLRCVENRAVSAEVPDAIVAEEVPA
jgi:hypothetical protein